MISKLAKGMACFFVDNKIIEAEDSEVYAYGIELLLSTIFNLVVAIIIALISNEIIPCFINLTAFVTIRIYAGGYHADTHLGCMLTLVCVLSVFILSIKTISITTMSMLSPILWILSAIILFRFAPVEHPNKPISEKKKMKLRKKSLISFFVWSIFCIIFYFVKSEICFYAIAGIFTLNCAMLAEKIKLYMKLK
jgi:accessory gene regulator B